MYQFFVGKLYGKKVMLNTVTEAIERPFLDFPNTLALLLAMVSYFSVVEELFNIYPFFKENHKVKKSC